MTQGARSLPECEFIDRKLHPEIICASGARFRPGWARLELKIDAQQGRGVRTNDAEAQIRFDETDLVRRRVVSRYGVKPVRKARHFVGEQARIAKGPLPARVYDVPFNPKPVRVVLRLG